MIITQLPTEISMDFKLGKIQSHKNMAIVPITTPENNYLDILTLKKGFELELVEVIECEKSTVNTIQIKNESVSPLILIEGEEILGSMQNRIINHTTVVPPKTTAHVDVNCTERGRWHSVSHKFRQSEYMANSKTRLKRVNASLRCAPEQSNVWNAIDELEDACCFKSPTSAMSESYDNLKVDHDEFLNAFQIEDGQNGVAVIINGEIKGFELFYNPEIYNEYHEKVLRSYLIDAKNENDLFSVDKEMIKNVIENACNSPFNLKDTNGLEEAFEFENDDGMGTLYLLNNEIIHWSYLKKSDDVGAEYKANIHDGERLSTDI